MICLSPNTLYHIITSSHGRQEVEALEAIGHKRLLLLTGEHPKYPFELFLEAVSVVRF